MSENLSPLAWIAVSRAALKHNIAALRELLGTGPSDLRLIAVVKANGFGHGAAETARIFQETGADFFAVTTPNEAVELRETGIEGRILVFLPPLPEQIALMRAYDLDMTLCDEEALVSLVSAPNAPGRPLRVHLKVDTGMGRLGILPEGALALAQRIASEPNIQMAGIYTHFAHALDKDAGKTQAQFARFQKVLAELERQGIDPGLRHCANSAATLRFPEMRLDAVRPGTILYGQYPSAAVPRLLDLQETWRMQGRVVSVRQVPAGTAVGYGGEFVTRRASCLAVLPIGYADGFTVAPASATAGWRGVKTLIKDLAGRGPKLSVTLRGRRAPIVGRVAMQICTVDVTDCPDVAIGDIATVPARRITAGARLPRLYLDQFED
ncbi:MAG: alanine racemase [Armatimonadota bacterium]|nr:alanine racemase [Armatimonadota bacterium]